VRRVTGHAEDVVVVDGVATGVIVDGVYHAADLVIDASGRVGRVSVAHRPEAQRTDCKMAYAARQYQLHPGVSPGPRNGGPGFVAEHDGFFTLVFEQDAGTLTVLLVRRADDRQLAVVRDPHLFEAACAALPAIAAWTDPHRSTPIDAVRAGGGLVNEFRGQATSVVGLLATGDACCTTNPMGARGVALGMQTSAFIADVVEATPREQWAGALEAWARRHLEPWYHDHVAWDHTLLRRWAGEPIDPDGPLGLDVVAAAALDRPEFMATLGPFYGMAVGPDALAPLRATTRAMLRAGWVPPTPDGVSRAALVGVLQASAARHAPA
jgi:2-polyprenyl-6-methoxyphenol hydroxylase-like FAD-dependent oxidoreductase